MERSLLDNEYPKREEKSTKEKLVQEICESEELKKLLQQDQDLSRQLAAEEKLYAEAEIAFLLQQSQYLTDQLAVEEALAAAEAEDLEDVVVKVAGEKDALQND